MSNCMLDLLSSSGFHARTPAVNLREEQVALEVVRLKKNDDDPHTAATRTEGGGKETEMSAWRPRKFILAE